MYIMLSGVFMLTSCSGDQWLCVYVYLEERNRLELRLLILVSFWRRFQINSTESSWALLWKKHTQPCSSTERRTDAWWLFSQDWDKAENIPDPDAKKPEDWDEDMDGEWEPPMIPNPEYKVKTPLCVA